MLPRHRLYVLFVILRGRHLPELVDLRRQGLVDERLQLFHQYVRL